MRCAVSYYAAVLYWCNVSLEQYTSGNTADWEGRPASWRRSPCPATCVSSRLSTWPRSGLDILNRHTVYCTVLYCTVLYCTVLYCTVLYLQYHSPGHPHYLPSTVLYLYTVLYLQYHCPGHPHYLPCTVLYCTVLYCTVLYCTIILDILTLLTVNCTLLYCTVPSSWTSSLYSPCRLFTSSTLQWSEGSRTSPTSLLKVGKVGKVGKAVIWDLVGLASFL